MALALGIDIGGTFTDVVLADADGITAVVKLLTSGDEPARAAVDGAAVALERAGVDGTAVTRVVHGTTLATNAILERRDPPVACVTTRGFRALLHLGRHARVEEERFDLLFRPPAPVVDLARTFEVTERIGPDGTVELPLDEGGVRTVAEQLAAAGVTAVAVCLLHSSVNPAHERRVRELLEEMLTPTVEVVLSSDIWPEAREYERATTTAMSAFVGPLMTRYLRDLESRLRAVGVAAPLHVMESAGGVMPVALACRRAVATIESGPAAGAIAARVVGADHGHSDVIAFDMGGTTAKAAVIRDGRPDVTHQFQVGGRGSFGTRRSGTGVPIKTPTIDLAEVGAGGGSIAWIDAAGALHVGPRSAGSDPGPAWYGRGGTAPTVTDAGVVLGYLDPAGFAAGDATGPPALRFDPAASREAIERHVAVPLGVPVERAAAAIHEIANATMAGAIEVVTVQRGIDPRRFTIVASGGAGPLHAARIAQRFEIATVIVAPACGVASALGLLASDLHTELVRSAVSGHEPYGAGEAARVARVLDELAASAATDLGVTDPASLHVERAVDVRYPRQAHELTVPVPAGPIDERALDAVREAFFERHREAFGVGDPGPVELVTVRLRATRPVPHVRFARPDTHDGRARSAGSRTRPVWSDAAAAFVATPVHDLAAAPVGVAIEGPALLEAPESTVLVPVGWTATVEPSRAVVLTRGEGAS
jgi:N-methylhydantoinase A